MLSRGGEDIDPVPKYLQAATRHLYDMDRYCSGTICRHRALVGRSRDVGIGGDEPGTFGDQADGAGDRLERIRPRLSEARRVLAFAESG